jgi:hypothetical protein
MGDRLLTETSKYLAIAVETWLLPGAVSASLNNDANARMRDE